MFRRLPVLPVVAVSPAGAVAPLDGGTSSEFAWACAGRAGAAINSAATIPIDAIRIAAQGTAFMKR